MQGCNPINRATRSSEFSPRPERGNAERPASQSAPRTPPDKKGDTLNEEAPVEKNPTNQIRGLNL